MADRREIREFAEVIDWELFQYSEIRKVPNPPWKWFKFQMTFLRSPQWMALTKPRRADFIAILGAASETGNMVPLDQKWLRAREISLSSIEKLSKIGLVRRFSLPPDHKRIKELRRVFSGGPPAPEAAPEPETEPATDTIPVDQPEIPNGLNRDAWDRYLQHRRDIRAKPLTLLGVQAGMKKWAQYSLEAQLKAVEDSIANGWIGCFPEKHQRPAGRGSYYDELRSGMKQLEALAHADDT